MQTIKTTTGAAIALDGDLLAILETLYREITVKRNFDRSFEDMIQEIRQLAEEVLATAEDASERVTLPEMLAEPEPDTEEDVPTTSEVDLDVLPGGAEDTDEDTAPDTR